MNNNAINSFETRNQDQQGVPKRKSKKKSGFLKVLFVFVILVAVAIISVYALLPGMLRPYDLGIKSSDEAYDRAMQKLNLKKDNAPTQGNEEDYQYIYGEAYTVNSSLSSGELTSFFNMNRPPYYALKNVQIRINDDNTIETSATIDTSYVFNHILDGKYTKEEAIKSLPVLRVLPKHANIYFRISGKINNNELQQIDIRKASVMGVPLPDSLLTSNGTQEFMKDTIGDYLNKITAKSNARFDLIEVKDGNLEFNGQLPSSITRIKR